MSLYNVPQDHPVVSDYTKNLSEDQFSAYLDMAEALFGLTDPAATNAIDIARIHLALVLQINFMSQYGLDPYIKASEGMSSQASSSVVWRDRYIDPRALAIVNAVFPPSRKQWFGADVGSQSHRTNDYGRGFVAYAPNRERFR